MIILRDYQELAVESVYPLNPGNRKLIVIPTGGGKSLVIAKLAQNESPFTRVLILTNTEELVVQNEEDMRALDPELDVGVFCAGLGRRDADKTVTIASVQSVFKRLEFWYDVDLIIIDEAHRISPKDAVMYKAVLEEMPEASVIGLTATPFRPGTGYLHQGKYAIFDEISYEVPYDELVAQGWLVPFAEKGSDIAYDASQLHMRAGEFKSDELAELVDYPKTKAIVEQFLARSEGRKHKMIFAINVRHCFIIKEVLDSLGVSCDVIHSNSKAYPITKDERRDRIAFFKAGLTDILINCGILTTGFNFPALDCVGIFRPIGSIVLYIQILGRLTRTSPATGKIDGLVLDYGGNISRHGHFASPDIREKGKGGSTKHCTDSECGEKNSVMARYCFVCGSKFNEMFKECPECGDECDRANQTCKRCGYGWPVSEHKLDEDGSTVLPNKAIWLQVSSWSFRVHKKAGQEGGPKSFVAMYKTVDGAVVQEYVFPEHEAARPRFVKWWNAHYVNGYDDNPPMTAGGCYGKRSELRIPTQIKVIRSGKIFTFLGRRFIAEKSSPATERSESNASEHTA